MLWVSGDTAWSCLVCLNALLPAVAVCAIVMLGLSCSGRFSSSMARFLRSSSFSKDEGKIYTSATRRTKTVTKKSVTNRNRSRSGRYGRNRNTNSENGRSCKSGFLLVTECHHEEEKGSRPISLKEQFSH